MAEVTGQNPKDLTPAKSKKPEISPLHRQATRRQALRGIAGLGAWALVGGAVAAAKTGKAQEAGQGIQYMANDVGKKLSSFARDAGKGARGFGNAIHSSGAEAADQLMQEVHPAFGRFIEIKPDGNIEFRDEPVLEKVKFVPVQGSEVITFRDKPWIHDAAGKSPDAFKPNEIKAIYAAKVFGNAYPAPIESSLPKGTLGSQQVEFNGKKENGGIWFELMTAPDTSGKSYPAFYDGNRLMDPEPRIYVSASQVTVVK